jgi:hopene-associated glycosyltransferase HpnB
MALAPWRPWSTREALDADDPPVDEGDLEDVTVLIPARNEARIVPQTLPSVARQGRAIRILLIDDGSTDGTAERACEVAGSGLQVLHAEPLPAGWGGKLWALEQGRRHVATSLTLLLDADIALSEGTVSALRRKMRRDGISFISLTAVPALESLWEKLLMPAFVYFFKVLYPFRLSNSPGSRIAAAAGGCILMETRLFDEIGGLESIRGALIDDCALARRIKEAGGTTWIGLTHSARSIRAYEGLEEIWNMVARTAFTQLGYSAVMLVLCTLAMALAFWAPVVAVAAGPPAARLLSAGALAGMALLYRPTLAFYGRSWTWSLALPLTAALFLAMTWTSAVRFWKGERSRWKDRVYDETMTLRRGS